MFRRHASGDARWIVFGLGNPGPRYEGTRHNAGARVVETLLERSGGRLKAHKSGALIAEVDVGGDRAVLARSTGYMNDSGNPVSKLMRWYKSRPDRLIVVHDEIDIPFGEIRIKSNGGTAGHNGLRSISDHLGTKEFTRVRFGASRPRQTRGAADHVLAEFNATERKELPHLLEAAADAVEMIISYGVERAMNEVNTRK
ncbi:MAG TPA: aminoacyl-tRNA hydrolase [Actinomycetota bacterium]|nr:aminoacyl-tRNA hydrolase [Actinomycetota bacterium]